VFYDYPEMLDFITQAAKKVTDDVYVFAHNALYDFSLTGLKKFIIQGLDISIGKGEFKRQDKFMVENIIWVRYDRHYRLNGKVRIQHLFFVDSYQYLNSSLKKLAASFLGEKKYAQKEYDYDYKEWNKYIAANGADLAMDDTVKLYNILKSYFTFLKENDVPFSFSASANAFSHFRYKFLHRVLYFPNDEPYLKALLEAYRGGFTNLFRPGKHKKVIGYDVNSLYSYSMKGRKMPVSFVKRVDMLSTENYAAVKKKFYVIANVKFSLPESERISFIVKNINGKLYPLRSGELYLHEPEIDYLIEKGANLTIGEAFIYKCSYNLFDEYIDFWYGLKKKADAAKDEAKRAMTKLFLNGLYGKFGQHKAHSELRKKDVPEVFDSPARLLLIEGGKKTVVTDYGYFVSVRKDGDPRYSLEIAGAVTAVARMVLRGYIEAAGIDDVIYCDTDSIHTTTRSLDRFVGNNIGQLKVEEEGSGEYFAPKVYSIYPTTSKTALMVVKDPQIHLKPAAGPIIKYKGVNIYKSKQLDAYTWQVKQFSRTKDVAWEGVRVINRIKTMTLKNDKFKWIDGKAYCWTEEEINGE
jgi:hypothetical protein